MPAPDTKVTILDAAEALFGEHGYAATSLRQLTKAAGTNLAAVNYHFGSKEELAKAVLARRIAPINQERLRRLQALPARASVEAVLRAFVEPPLRASPASPADGPSAKPASRAEVTRPGDRLCRVFGRISVEQPRFLRTFLRQQFREVGRRFEVALGAALPGHGAATIWWRLHFIVGAMAHTLQNSEALSHLTGGLCDPADVDTLVEHLVAFAIGGLRAAPIAKTVAKTIAKKRASRRKEVGRA
ncbi:MAG: TetR/AcrR family transcriptional regulator [Planctomycetota bacterium]